MIAKTKENNARDHKVELGINSKANKIPNWAEDIVAPVVGETNLFIHSCCIINPATLIPIPVQRIANKRGILEMMKILITSLSPDKRALISVSITPTNNDITDKTTNIVNKIIVDRYLRIITPP